MSRGGPKIHAVVWRSAGSEVPADLIGALARQGIAWEKAIGPFDAVSRLLAKRADGPGGRVMLLVEPTSLDSTGEVRAAIDRFDPSTVCWAYHADQNPRLAPLAPLAKPVEPEVVVLPRPSPQAGPRLRLAGSEPGNKTTAQAPSEATPPSERGGSSSDQAEPESPRSVLTPEELAMLLADDRE